MVVVEARTCRDNPCEDNARCLDVDGGFKCQCKSGYKQDGPNCIGKQHWDNLALFCIFDVLQIENLIIRTDRY